MSVLTYVVVFTVNVLFAIAVFLGMIVGLNGFSERDAKWGIYFFVATMSLSVAAVPAFAVIGRGMLLRRAFSQAKSSLIAMFGFSVAGFLLTVAIAFMSVMLVEIVRNIR